MSDVIKVLIVDDSAFMRTTLRSIIRKQKDMEIIGVAKDGLEGVKLAKELQPNAITLDVEMPRMDGLTAIKPILQVCDAAVLMVSSLTTSSSQAALTAMRNGASDVVAKENPDKLGGGDYMERELVMKLRAIAHSKLEKKERRGFLSRLRNRKAGKPSPATESMQDRIKRRIDARNADRLLTGSTSGILDHEEYEIPAHVTHQPMSLRAGDYDIMVIGSSTGGPPVLETICTMLPAHMPMPIVVAQHMPLLFTKSMSERLNRVSAVDVVHLEPGMEIKKGVVHIAPGGSHTHLKKRGPRITVEVGPEPSAELYKPSVNVLFDTASEIYGARTLGVMLTGMGEDGRVGSEALVKRGGKIIAQDEQSCVVYGMPRAVTEHNLIVASLDPKQIGQSLATLGH